MATSALAAIIFSIVVVGVFTLAVALHVSCGFGCENAKRAGYEEADRDWKMMMVRRGLARWSVDENCRVSWEWIEEDSQGSGQ
jgi:hypothetical protein